jgi:hypothetical protein
MNIRCWEVSAYGMVTHYRARTPGRARMWAALALKDIGWSRTIGDALRAIKMRRFSIMDGETEGQL